MADCRKNNNYPLIGTSALIRNICFDASRKEVQLIDASTGAVECTRNIDSAAYLGVKIVGGNLVYADAIAGLPTSMTMAVGNNPTITITQGMSGILNIIGVDDINNGFSVPQINVRYDAATNSVKFQL